MSVCAYIDTHCATPAPDDAALKRSVNVMILFVMWPPALHPIFTMRSGSAMPRRINSSTPAMTSRCAFWK